MLVEDFLKMDIFFVVTTLVVAVLGLFAAIALYYVVRILRNVEHISHNVAEESDNLRADIAQLRERVRAEGFRLKHVAAFVRSLFGRAARVAKKKRK
ncbi:hypothetical protein COU20_03405 [Candidatus Kaiserbacteria bacterium CG10_big_fil_rev_8_21_14_0_10_59_10]|uniref:DUF948 domain-containing protein n=1 Tax=Candidatus Kaiserbacteria bacterium CG10_big_fil_rev_8_21_14_0_10_59_10 TaxID=1974612 RepID=A0A2H0U771_9BACT|nr:MAG: hypothetical protein COU20_03405 [Candidatus Kaiserbacteria bacterium CG10_big_fil_rev_8_21_14_0_10_59_10]